MNDYDIVKEILNRKRKVFINPCEDTDEDKRKRWEEDWKTNKLLLNLCNDILLIFDRDGQFQHITRSY